MLLALLSPSLCFENYVRMLKDKIQWVSTKNRSDQTLPEHLQDLPFYLQANPKVFENLRELHNASQCYEDWQLLLLLLAHAGRVGLFCLQVKELSNLYRPKPQVCWGEWGGVLGAVEKVTFCVGGKGTGWAKVGDGAVEAG